MRRLAEHLGVSAPTLYWHVKNRDELMDLAVEAALDGGDVTTSDDPDWRVQATEFMHGLRARLAAHPWVTELTRNRYTHSVHQFSVRAVEVAATIGLSPADHGPSPADDLAGQRVHHHGEQRPRRHRLPPADRHRRHVRRDPTRLRTRPGADRGRRRAGRARHRRALRPERPGLISSPASTRCRPDADR